MRGLVWLTAACAAVSMVGACTGKTPAGQAALGADGAGPAPAPAAPAVRTYEAVYIPGSPQVNPGFVRIQVSTGRSVVGWGVPADFAAIPDAPIPAGDYHLYPWSQTAAADGHVSWGVARMDSVSGRTWVLNGGGGAPFTWIELTPPK